VTPGTYQAVLGDAQDHLAVEVSAAEMLGDGQPAQAVAGVVEIPGSGGGYWGAERGAGVPGGPPSPMPAPSWYSLARLVEQPAGRALAAQEDVFLQRRLVEHPVRRAERRVAWGGGGELVKCLGGPQEGGQTPPQAPSHPPPRCCPADRITECSGLEGTSGGHPVPPPAQAGSPRAGCTAPRPGRA